MILKFLSFFIATGIFFVVFGIFLNINTPALAYQACDPDLNVIRCGGCCEWSNGDLTCSFDYEQPGCSRSGPGNQSPICSGVSLIASIGATGVGDSVPINTIASTSYNNHPWCAGKTNGTDEDLDNCLMGFLGFAGPDPFVAGDKAFNVGLGANNLSLSVANGGTIVYRGTMEPRKDVDCWPMNNPNGMCTISGVSCPGGCTSQSDGGAGCVRCIGNTNIVPNPPEVRNGSYRIIGSLAAPKANVTLNLGIYTKNGATPNGIIYDISGNTFFDPNGSVLGSVCSGGNCSSITGQNGANQVYLITPGTAYVTFSISYSGSPNFGKGYTVSNIRPFWNQDSTKNICPNPNRPADVVVSASDDRGWSNPSTQFKDITATFRDALPAGVKPNFLSRTPFDIGSLYSSLDKNLRAQVIDSGAAKSNECSIPLQCSKSCSITSVTPSSTTQGSNITVGFKGYASLNNKVRLFVTKDPGNPIGSTPPTFAASEVPTGFIGTAGAGPPYPYYQIGECISGASGCIGTSIFSLPALGKYFLHCDADSSNANRCSGNPYCSYKIGSAVCIPGWYECDTTNNDYKRLSIVTPPMVNITGAVFNDIGGNEGCFDSVVDQYFPTPPGVRLDTGSSPVVSYSQTSPYNFTVPQNALNSFYLSLLDTSLNQSLVSIINNATCATVNKATLNVDGSGNGSTGNFSTVGLSNAPYWVSINQNIAWMSVFGGSVYANNPTPGGIAISIPPTGGVDNWFILPNGPTNLAGMAISTGGIDTLRGTGTNRTSKSGTQPVGWQVTNYSAIVNGFANINFAGLSTNPLVWSSLVPNKSYVAASLPASYDLTGNGVSVVYINGPLTISSDFRSPDPTKEGVILVVNGNVTIESGVTQIDALIIASGQIKTNPSNNILDINGGLISKVLAGTVGIDLKNRSLLINNGPAVRVYFQPVYLTNINSDLVKPSISGWKELAPQ